MRNIKSYLLFLLLLNGCLFFLNGQSNVLPIDSKKIQLDGKEFYLHVVEKGEGLYRISVNYGVSMSEILKANPDIDEQLRVGQIIRIPIISGRNSDDKEMTQSREYIYHTVEKGQTAYFIARKYDLTLEQLYHYNPGIEHGLVLGAILKIPSTPPVKKTSTISQTQREVQKAPSKYITHIVRPKETLYSISKQYSTTIESIINDNPALRNGVLAIGAEIRIERPTPSEIAEKTSSTSGNEVGEFIKGENYLYHMIEAGQTLYSISRQYLIDVSDLKAANPDIGDSDLRVGYLLRIPRPVMDDLNTDLAQQKENPRWFTNHKVRRKETLFGISQKYHIDIDVIKRVNPSVNFSNLNKGTILRIPKDEWFAAKNMAALLEEQDAVIEDSLRSSMLYDECVVNKELGYTQPLKVALMLPFNAKESSRYYSLDNDSVQFSREMSATAQRSRVFTEFYSGALMALDSLKTMGISVDLSVFDISPDSLAIKRVLKNPVLEESDLIIGPGLGHELTLISNFSKKNGIPLVFPISNNTNGEIFSNPYLFQVNSPDSLLFDRMAKEIVQQSLGSNLIIILPPAQEKDAQTLVQRIKEQAAQQMMLDKKVNYIEYKPKGDDLIAIQALVSKELPNYIVVPSVAAAEISKIIPVLKGVKEKSKAEINLYGRSEWLRMQTIDPEDIHYLNTTVFSPFRLDYNIGITKDFITKYRSWYHMEPHAISPYFQYSDATSGFSRFGIWGYDVTFYFISAMTQYGENFDLCLDQVKHHEIQFNFDFQRISNWGGFYNKGFFKLNFTPDLKTIQSPIVNR